MSDINANETPGLILKIFVSSALCSRGSAARCMNIRAAQMIKYGQSVLVTNVSTFLIFFSIINANKHCKLQMPLTPEFEAEQITGDIQDIKEPQELKFKVVEDMAS
jgi:hypothetical protein